MAWLRPPALPEDGLVRVVAPSGPFPRERFDRGVAVLEKRGYQVRFDDGVFATDRYLAGPDDRRLAELRGALEEPGVHAVWAARGGYGAMRLLADLDVDRLRRSPRALVGFSDVTALHALAARAEVVSIHAPVVCGVGEAPDEALDLLWRILSGETPGPLLWEPLTTVRDGRAAGRLLGGNLSVLTRLLGTPFWPDLRGAVLFIEDVAERPYRLDRMLTHLELSGAIDGIAGVLVGGLTGCEEPDAEYTAAEVVAERIARWNVPAALGFPTGHGEINYPLPLGAEVTLDTGEGRLDWSGPALEPR